MGTMLFRMDQPVDLVREVVYNLPVELFESSTTTFLDPAMGKGDYLVMVATRLKEYGHSKENILSRLYGVETNQLYVNRCLNKTPLRGAHIEVKTYEEVLEWKPEMKFDVVIGNPPYQASGKENKAKLWPQFIDMSFDHLVTTGGCVALVTPKQWLTNGQWEKYFILNQIIKLNVDQCKIYFEDIHSSFSYFIVQAQPGTQAFEVVTGDGLTTTWETPPPTGMELMYTGVVKKLINGRSYFPMVTSSGYNTSGFSSNKATLSRVKTDDHPYFVVHKISHAKGETVGFWASTLDHTTYGVPRVIAGLWLSDWKRDRMIVSADTLTCEQFRHFPAPTIEQAKVLRDVLSSKLYTYLLYNIVDGNSAKSKAAGSITNRAVSYFPVVDLTRSWTDEELYKHFNLTQDEIDLIEETVK